MLRAESRAAASFRGVDFPSHLFRPKDPVLPWIVKAIELSRRSVQVAVYELNLPEVGEALRKAKARGVLVAVLLDQRNLFPKDEQGGPAPINAVVRMLLEEGFEFRVLRGAGDYGSMHNKFALFDEQLLEVGSYNWKDTAENQHYENVRFVEDPELLEGFSAYWSWMWKNGQDPREVLRRGPGNPYVPPQPPEAPQDSIPGVYFHGVAFPEYIFSPNGGGDKRIRKAMWLAKKSIDVAMFSFYSFPTAGSLVGAHERGVKVRVLLDKNQALKEPVLKFLLEKGLEVRLLAGPTGEGPHDRMHNKFCVLDWTMLQSGSYNYSPGAEARNYENIYFQTDPGEVEAFSRYFEEMWARAQPVY